jgi:hypothetical protein
MTTEIGNSIQMERYAGEITNRDGNRIRGVGTPFGVPNGRPGSAWQINAEGFPEIVRYDGTIFEPEVFSAWIASENASRVRFLFQHGDAGQGWADVPMGAMPKKISRSVSILILKGLNGNP